MLIGLRLVIPPRVNVTFLPEPEIIGVFVFLWTAAINIHNSEPMCGKCRLQQRSRPLSNFTGFTQASETNCDVLSPP